MIAAADGGADDRPDPAELVAILRGLFDGRSLRVGKMFGHPALYVRRTMFACVYGSGVGLRVPANVASSAIEGGRAIAFQPHRKPAMREWIELRPMRGEDLASDRDLIVIAYEFAVSRLVCG